MQNGIWRVILIEDWGEGVRGIIMLDVTLINSDGVVVYQASIPNNMYKIAKKVGVFNYIWYPGKRGIKKAKFLLEPLQASLAKLTGNSDYSSCESYGCFLEWVIKYKQACEDHPEARIVADSFSFTWIPK